MKMKSDRGETLTGVAIVARCWPPRARARGRRHLRTPAQSRAAQLAHAPSRLRRAALFAARHDQQVEREESQARLRRGDGRHIGEREPPGDATGRRRLYVHGRAWGVVYKIDLRSGTMGRILWKMDPGQEKIDRNRGVALWGNLVVSVTSQRARHRDRQGDWQDRLGQEPARPAGHGAHRGAPCAQGQDHHRRLGRRPGRAQLAGRARRQDRQRDVEDIRRPRARRARQRDLEGQDKPGRPAAAPSTSPAPTTPTPTHLSGARAIRRRNTIPPTGPATISTPTA